VSATVQIACPACLAANRVPAARTGEDPKCGKCGAALLDGAPVELGEGEFDAFLQRTGLPVLADFWAPWCGPCRAMAPHFERAARELKDRVRLVKVNTEQAQGLAARYAIRAIPTLVLFRNGAEVKRASGAMDAATLARWAA
jgi:thioredoxin 2